MFQEKFAGQHPNKNIKSLLENCLTELFMKRLIVAIKSIAINVWQ